MADIKPFQALRFSEKRFPTPPVAPPYDIISEKRRSEIARDSYNIIHIDKPGPAADAKRYERAAALLAQWKNEGVLITEEEEALYVYQETYTVPERDNTKPLVRTGFFACLKLVDFTEGIVLPHEKTLAAPKVDRMNLMKATKGNMSPIFGLYHDTTQTIAPVIRDVFDTEPVYTVYKDSDGTEHTLWRLTDRAKIQRVVAALKNEKIIIADGHHRYETALSYRDYLAENGLHTEAADYIMLCLVDFSDEGLVVLPTHRLLEMPIATDELLQKLSAYFDVEKTTKQTMTDWVAAIDAGIPSIGLYTKEKTYYRLTLKKGCAWESLMPAGSSAAWKQLNVSILSFVVFKTVLSLSEEKFQQVVSYTHSFFEALEAVDTGAAGCTFLLQGIDKFTVKEISENGELMPQKSTYFYPKLFTGFVMYEHGKG